MVKAPSLFLAAVLIYSPLFAAPTAPPLPEAYSGHAVVASGDFLYSLGGLGAVGAAASAPRVFYAPIGADGSVGAWTAGPDLPTGIFFHAAAAAAGTLYVLGGYHISDTMEVSDAVYYSRTGPDGRPGPWQEATRLPETVFFPSAAFWNGRLYVTGGWTGSQLTAGVYSAEVRSDGSLGPWVTQRSLPEGIYTHSAVSAGTLYVLGGGGSNGGGVVQNTVYAAKIAPDGSLDPWRLDSALPEPVSNHAAVIAGGRVIVSGGWTGPAATNAVVLAPIAADGSLGTWSELARLPKLLYLHGAAAWKSWLYVVGGSDGQYTQDAVHVLELPAPLPPPQPDDVLPPRTTLAVSGTRYGEAPLFVTPAGLLSLSAVDDRASIGDGAGVGVASTEAAFDDSAFSAYAGPITAGAEGAHWLRWFSVDAGGRAESVRAQPLAVDGTAPRVSVSAGAPRAELADGSVVVGPRTYVAVSAEDPAVAGAASGLERISAAVDGSPVDPAAPFLLPASDGAKAVTASAVDRLGHESVAAGVFLMDATAPRTSWTAEPAAVAAPDGGADWLRGGALLRLAAADPAAGGVAAGVHHSEFSVDGGAWTQAAAFGLEEGERRVRLRSVDSVGNEETPVSAAFRVDATAPLTTLEVAGPEVSLAAEDPLSGGLASGVSRLTYSVDGGPELEYAAPFRLAEGEHVISYGASDLAGNAEPRRSAPVSVAPADRQAPLTTLAVGAPSRDGDPLLISPAAPLTLSASDAGAGVEATYFAFDDAPFAAYAAPLTAAVEGAHWLRFYSVDRAGNQEAVTVRALAVDGTAPRVTVEAGAPQARRESGELVLGPGTLVAVSAEDPVVGGVAAGVERLEAWVNGSPVDASAAFALPGEGAHAVRAVAGDALGASAEASASFWVDATAPLLSWSAAPAPVPAHDGGSPWLRGDALVSVSAEDPAVAGVSAGLLRLERSVDGGDWAPAAGFGLPEGVRTAALRAVDGVGNAASLELSLRVDGTAPATTLEIGGPVSTLEGRDYATPQSPVTLSAADPLSGGVASGVAALTYSLDGGPALPYTGPFFLPEGDHTLSYGAVDLAGNAEPRRAASVSVRPLDAQAPVTTFAAGAPSFGTDPLFVSPATPLSLSASDAGTGVEATFWALDDAPFARYAGPVTAGQAGARWLRFYSVDRAGNQEAVRAVALAVDGAAPRASIEPGAPRATLASGEVILGAETKAAVVSEDPGSPASGVGGVSAWVDGVPVDAGAPFALGGEGLHEVRAEAVDRLGQAGSAQASFWVDATAPTLSWSAAPAPVPASDGGAPWLPGGAAVSLSAEDPALSGAAAGVRLLEYSVDGGAWTPASSFGLEEGARAVRARAADAVGNESAVLSLSLRVDAHAPVSSLRVASAVSSLLGRELVTPETDLELSAEDPVSGGVASGVAALTYSVDGGPVAVYAGPFRLPPGEHTVVYGAVDRAGNVEQTQTAAVAVATLLADTLQSLSYVTLDGGAQVSGTVAANGEFKANGNSSVEGSVTAAEARLEGGAAVSGQTTLRSAGIIEAFSLPAALEWAAANNDNAALPAGTLSGGALKMTGGSLSLPGGTYLLESLELTGKAKVSVSGRVQLFVKGPVKIGAGAALNDSGAAGDLWIVSQGTEVSLNGKGRVAWHLYAPRAQVDLAGGGRFAGRLLGGSVKVSGHSASPDGTGLAAVERRGRARKADKASDRPAQAGPGRGRSGFSEVLTARLEREVPEAKGVSAQRPERPGKEAAELGAPAAPEKLERLVRRAAAGSPAAAPRRVEPTLAALSSRLEREDPRPGRGGSASRRPESSLDSLPQPKASRRSDSVRLAPGAAWRAPAAAVAEPSGPGKGRSPRGETAVARARLDPEAPAARLRREAVLALGPAPSAAPARRGAALTRRPSTLPPLPVSARAAFSVVGQEGRAVRSAAGAGVVVPPGAAAQTVALTVSPASEAEASRRRRDEAKARRGLSAAGAAVEYGPHGTRFEKPVTLELPIDPAHAEAASLAVHYWNPSTEEWEALPSSVDRKAGLVRAQTDHFSLYQVLAGGSPAAAAAGELAFGEVYAFPNPARPGQTPVVHVDAGTAETVEVRVYDVSGRLVATLSRSGSGDLAWDGAGAGTGVYLFVVTARNGGATISTKGRLAVIR